MFHFLKGGNPQLSQMKRDNMFIQMFEGLSAEEAELLVEGEKPTPKTQFQVSYTHWAPMSQQQQ